jgi:hypothetical protein
MPKLQIVGQASDGGRSTTAFNLGAVGYFVKSKASIDLLAAIEAFLS